MQPESCLTWPTGINTSCGRYRIFWHNDVVYARTTGGEGPDTVDIDCSSVYAGRSLVAAMSACENHYAMSRAATTERVPMSAILRELPDAAEILEPCFGAQS